jgi:metal-responsive CopG/Arc/MetJ family transcriptional regulator
MSRVPITISLPSDLAKETSRFCKIHSLTVSEVARKAFHDYLYKEELDQTRKRFTLHVRKLGIKSERELIESLQR